MKIRRVATLRTADDLRAHLHTLGAQLPLDERVEHGPDSPLAQPFNAAIKRIGNRFAVLPMEGWDGTEDGRPTDLVRRRWQRFGQSGAKLIWGGEAVAVCPEGRANPNQLIIDDNSAGDLEGLRRLLIDSHEEAHGRSDDLLVGLQLTHSGRFARPCDKTRMEPRTLYRHPILDAKFGVEADRALLTDDEIDALIVRFVHAAKLAWQAGYEFVDIKHCHGYLGHEFLSAWQRPGRYGGSFENRTRFLRAVVDGIRREVPGLAVGVRLSAFDFVPFQPGEGTDRVGQPVIGNGAAYRYAFGGDGQGVGIDLTETVAFLDLLVALDIELVCITAGSPYYCPHIQRPALFPPSDGYQPPEDPLVGVARQIAVVAELKRLRPGLIYVGSGYSYLQEWFANVAQAAVRTGQTDFVGLGRMMLSYPELPADILAGKPYRRKQFCRTFSDCTTAPRNGMISGCFPLDEFYKQRPEAEQLALVKQAT